MSSSYKSVSEAAALIEAYFEVYPEIQAFGEYQKAFAHEHGYVETLFGRRCFIPEIRSHTPAQRQFAGRQAMNAPIQGTNADIMKKVMIELMPLLEKTATHLVLQIHDELVFEGPAKELDLLAPLIQKRMEDVLLGSPLAMPLKVCYARGKTWAEAHA